MNWLADLPEDDAAHFTAQAFLGYFLECRGLTLADLAVRPSVVATFQPYIYRHLVQATSAEPAKTWVDQERFPLAHGRYAERDVSVVLLPVGAPAAITFFEELAAGGARNVIAVGAAGSLQAYAPVPAAVLPTEAIREEGTSYHYAPPAAQALPDPAALDAIRAACRKRGVVLHEGPIWTTDAPFRELSSKVQRFTAAGVVAVDMEASALYVVGALRQVRVASLFIISDELFHPWKPAFFDREYREAARLFAECALAAAALLSDE